MKILAFTDTHGSSKAIRILIEKAKDADLLVCAGDISNWGTDLDKILKQFEATEKILLIVPGNHEDEEGMMKICNKLPFCRFLHKGSYEIDDFVFFGFGGGGFSERDRDFERIAELFRKDCRKVKKVIFVTHAPPYGTRLDYLSGIGYRGSKSYRQFDEEVKPILHICGHLHENSGNTDMISNHTLVVNPGPIGLLIEI